ncbi:tRNA synthetases class I-domain-containing protein [Ganoderma leucocontextum]|nr:tRNA synthetases class I-domain-containing protein [Ganoderma leucocontextum]
MSDSSAQATPADTPSGTATPTEGGTVPLTKSAEKKLAKKKENEARLALKAAKAANSAAATPAGESKKAKKEKEAKEEEPEFVNTTPKGEKKDLSQPMSSGYNPIAVESAWYDWWDAQGFFAPQLTPDGKIKPEGVFVIPSPPPNVTGSLHIGHALTVAIQDCLVRWNRMLGKTTLFVPGFDHAGISTQSVVEKRLYKTGMTRHDLGREAFVGKVWEWKEDYQARITNQLRRLGGSYDWDRVAFTMNESLSKAVIETFCRLHEEGTLYRANRLVNWCVRLNTTLSNLEVEQKQLDGRTLLNVPGYDIKEKFEFGVITSFAYPIEGSDEKIIVATTRPETMLGDTAIAVHPEDPRYKHLHGKFAKHPFVDRRIPIVTDDIAVDMAFGTGAVKITPAHDQNDYEVGQRHGLEFINVMNDDGTFNENAGERFRGVKRFHARVQVVQALKDAGLYVETKDNPMQIPICSKSGDVIEPILKPQWWVDCKPLAEKALERTRAGDLFIQPKSSESEWYRWLEGIQDWCISRQLWWGHRCPAYFVNIDGQEQDRSDGKNWVVGRTLEEATANAKKVAGDAKFTLEQDEDVLDTWFSSGLWPWSIMGWPAKTSDFDLFYPSSILETGWDILFFWVARMVLLGVHLTDKVPFSEVYCHAMIRDAHGRKMSKSLGNVIDPLDVIQGLDLEALHQKLYEGNLDEREIAKAKAGQKKDFPKGIPQCGTDALRFALCAYSGGGRDINLEILRVEGYRKFCNKIFNATKFAMLKLDEKFVPEPTAKPTGNESLVEKWILHKLNLAAEEINKQLAERNFMNATGAAHNFWLYELCDVYIEAMKPMTDESASETTRRSAQQTLYTCLDHGLRLLHPFMPFVTEELWQRLPRRPNDPTPSIMLANYPTSDKAYDFTKAERDFDLVFSAVKSARGLAASYNILQNLHVYIRAENDAEAQLFRSQIPTFLALTKNLKSVEVVRDIGGVPEGCGSELLSPTIFVHVLVRGQVDLDGEINKCEKKLALAKMNLSKVEKFESQADYETTVPESVRFANDEKRKTYEADIKLLEHSIDMFARMK